MRLLTTTALVAAFASPTLASEVELGFAHIGLYKTGINSAFSDADIDSVRADIAAGINVRGFRGEFSFITDRLSSGGEDVSINNMRLSFGSNFTDEFALGYYFSKTKFGDDIGGNTFDELGVISTYQINQFTGKITLGAGRFNNRDFETIWGLEAGYSAPFGLDLTLGYVDYSEDATIIKATASYEIANSGFAIEAGVIQSDFVGALTKGKSAYAGVKYTFGTKKRQFAPIVDVTEVFISQPPI